jgi:hypothetical protein
MKSTSGCNLTSSFQTVDFPNSDLTVVLGVNNLGYIVGYYQTSTTTDAYHTYGFVGIPSTQGVRRRLRR